jgi:hypothetical protein
MIDLYNIEEGTPVERLPDGRKGTFVGDYFKSIPLGCGCCTDLTFWAEVRWNDDPLDTEVLDPEELRLVRDE